MTRMFLVLAAAAVAWPLSLAACAAPESSSTTEAAYVFLDNIGMDPAANLTKTVPAIEMGAVGLLGEWSGLFPKLLPGPAPGAPLRWCNGGLPQLANLSAHAAKLAADVAKVAPAAGFAGFLVQDYESWTPQWNLTSDLYRNQSVLLAQAQHPNLTGAALLARAQADYEQAAMAFFVVTLQALSKIRPQARVGYYGYPHMPYWMKNLSEVQRLNDRDAALYRASSALFPSIYLPYKSGKDATFAQNQDYINRTVAEARRIAASLAGGAPVLPYAWHRYHDHEPSGLQLLTDQDTALELLHPKQLGARGVVLWGNEQNASAVAETVAFFARHRDEIDRAAGPSASRNNLVGSGALQLPAPPRAADLDHVHSATPNFASPGTFPPPWTPCAL